MPRVKKVSRRYQIPFERREEVSKLVDLGIQTISGPYIDNDGEWFECTVDSEKGLKAIKSLGGKRLT